MITRLLGWGVGLLAASFVLLAGTVLYGEAGAVVAGIGLAGAALIVVRHRLPARPAVATPRAAPADGQGPFYAFRSIKFILGWAAGTRSANRHERAVRPLLTRLAAAVLARRRHVDLHREALRARALLGPELWQLVDPDRPVLGDTTVGDEDVHRLVDR